MQPIAKRHSVKLISCLGALLSFAVGCSAHGEDTNSNEGAMHAAPTGADGAPTRRPDQVQMNDVAILYPLAKTEAEMAGYVSASDPGKGGAMLPMDLYRTAAARDASRLDYSKLKAVAFRMDPNLVRLTFQAVDFKDGAARADDAALHAYYSFTADEFADFMRAVIALRREAVGDKDLGALTVHPILSAQGLLGAEAKGLRDLVLARAGQSNLVKLTSLTADAAGTRWEFAGLDIHGSSTTPMVIPTLPAGTQSVTFFAGTESNFEGGFEPPTSATDNMQLLASLEKARQAPKAAQQAAFDAALRIENPSKNGPDTIDCASCHAAGVSRGVNGGKLGLSAQDNPNVFSPDPQFVSASDMRQTTPVSDDTRLNVHMFSYRSTQPMISARVINKSATTVATLNGTVFR